MAGFLYALVVLPAIEREGVTVETLEGLIAMGWILGIGPLVGALVSQARAQSDRYQMLLALHQTLAGGAPFDHLLVEGAKRIRSLLHARQVTLALALDGAVPRVVRTRSGASSTAQGAEPSPGSPAAWAWGEGRALFIADSASDPRLGGDGLSPGRPTQAFLVPLQGRERPLGVLVLERVGEISRAEREVLKTLGLHLGLGIENAALIIQQRRFAEELEEKVAAATGRLRQLDRMKSEFVSIVSHELRTPLTSLQGFSELLLTRSVSPERQRQFLGHVHQEAQRLGRIVSDLLDLSKIEGGQARSLHPEPLDIGPLLRANVDLLGVQSPAHEIRVSVAPDLPPVLADHDALDRVVKNLLSNATKYSPRGGPVDLRASASTCAPGMIEIEVEDYGVGIPPDAVQRIFEKYVRVSHPDTSRAGGLGIGLALVKSLVEAHGGTVRVASSPGKGSRFTVTFPQA
ncbi:MAG: ATP-binding protein [Candidatus Methylomirabilia bacterium]